MHRPVNLFPKPVAASGMSRTAVVPCGAEPIPSGSLASARARSDWSLWGTPQLEQPLRLSIVASLTVSQPFSRIPSTRKCFCWPSCVELWLPSVAPSLPPINVSGGLGGARGRVYGHGIVVSLPSLTIDALVVEGSAAAPGSSTLSSPAPRPKDALGRTLHRTSRLQQHQKYSE